MQAAAASSSILEALLPSSAAVQQAGSLSLLRHFAGSPSSAAAAAAAAEPEIVSLDDLLPAAIPIEQQDEQGLYRDLIVPVYNLSAAQVRRAAQLLSASYRVGHFCLLFSGCSGPLVRDDLVHPMWPARAANIGVKCPAPPATCRSVLSCPASPAALCRSQFAACTLSSRRCTCTHQPLRRADPPSLPPPAPPLQVGTYTLGGDIFDVPIRRDILHRVVRWQLAKRQQGTHKTKGRSEVRGGGRKPRPQKGSGNSRQGTIRAPQW